MISSALGGIIKLLSVTMFSFDSYGRKYSCLISYSESAKTT